MVIGRIRFLASTIAPKPEEIEYWIDLSEDKYGCIIKCYNGVEWERIDQRTYDEIISFKHKLDELLIEIQECENDLLQHKEDFEEYKDETNSNLNTINDQIRSINASLETLLGESTSEFIDKYNEILNFLTGYEDTDTLQSILSDLKNEISQNIIEIESNLTSHINNKNNPHNVTKEQIGLSNVDNTSDLNKPVSTATQNALNTVKQEITNDLNTHKQNTQNPHNVTKQQVGLSNVTNDAQVKRSEMGTANGIATLNEQGLIPSNQLPSYVDDVIECYATYSKEEDGTLTNIKLYSDAEHQNAITGESGKIYVDITGSDSAYQFRWTGTQFTVVGAPTVIGEVTGTAFDGKRGKDLEDKTNGHIENVSNPHNVTVQQIGAIPTGGLKTINGNTLEGEGDIEITSSGVGKVDYDSGGTGEIFNNYANNKAKGRYSHAENYNTFASGNRAHAEGDSTIASGDKSHAEGYRTTSKGKCSHSEGQKDTAVETPFFQRNRVLKLFHLNDMIYYASDSQDIFNLSVGELFKYGNIIYKITYVTDHSYGFKTSPNFVDNVELPTFSDSAIEIEIQPVTEIGTAIGVSSHHEGTNNCAYGDNSHAGGNGCQAIGRNSFVHGENLIASSDNQIVFGKGNSYDEKDVFQIGWGDKNNPHNIFSIDKAGATKTQSLEAHSILVKSSLPVYNSMLVGIDYNTIFVGNIGSSSVSSVSDGECYGIIIGDSINKIQSESQYGNNYYFVVGSSNNIKGGRNNLIIGEDNYIRKSPQSVCFGKHCYITGEQSFVTGFNSMAIGNSSTAIGGGGLQDRTVTNFSQALTSYESSFNNYNDGIHIACAKQSMVTGKNNLAGGLQSSAHGQGNVAKNDQEFVVGSFNDYSTDTNNLFVVGNGTSHTSRSNAFTVDNSGNSSFSGKINCKGIDAEGTCKMGTLTDIHDGDVPWYGVKLQAGEENGGNVWLSGYYGLHLKTNAGQLDFSINGQMTLNNSFTASGGFYESSDIRLKENVCDITTDKQIDLVQFNWKNTGKKSYGVIAQQIEQNYPELVETNEVTGYKTVKYDSVLILKCAQLENRIKQLEKQLEDLKNE